MTEQVIQQVDNPFGIEFITPEAVPAAPRQNERNDALWAAVKTMLPAQPGVFARVRIYQNASGAGQKAGAINNGRDKKFPKDKWAARYTVDRDAETSVLFLAYRNQDGTVNESTNA